MSLEDTSFGSVPIDWAEEPVPNLARFDTYEAARDAVTWELPETFNLATDIVTRHADRRGRVALHQDVADGGTHSHTFWDLERRSNALANALAERGVARGDRIAVLGTRSDQVMLTYLATWKLGAVSVPLSVLYGPTALEYRLGDADPVAVFADADQFDAVEAVLPELDACEVVVGYDERPDLAGTDTVAFADLDGSRYFEAVATDPTDPALILYTSGTTGVPKGVVQAHQVVVGWLPGFQMCYELPWADSDPVLYVTPSLAWIGGLNLVLSAWHYGFPVFRHDRTGGFDPESVYENIERWGLTRAVLVPAMLEPMSTLDAGKWDLSTLEVVMSGSEPVSEDLYEFVTGTLDARLNEMYGQTEAIHIVTSCSQWFDVEPGSLGFPAPGHDVAIVDEDGQEQPAGEVGHIALRGPNPAMFRELWNDELATESKFLGEWMDTGDLGYRDEDGRLWFKARDDDLIITAGYRVGPPEVENSIVKLPEVAKAGVIGVPDDERGEIIKAFVEPAPGTTPDEALKERIRTHVSEHLAKYQYPREIEFIEEMPTTVTGKIRRHKLTEFEGHDRS